MFDYPKEPREALRSMPRTLLVQAFSKVGKSSIAANLTTQFAKGESCVVSLGKEGSYDNHEVTEINVDKMSQFEALLDDMIKEQPYEFVIFDNLSVFDEWSEVLGTLEYMSGAQGKSFNLKARKSNPEARGPGFSQRPDLYFNPTNTEFETVHTLAQGYGYRWSRSTGIRLYNKMKQVANHVIFIGHIKEDRYTKDDSGKVTKSEFLDVTGGLGRYICKDIDALATLSRKKNEGFLSFKTGHSDLSAGTRYHYLENQTIKISEKLEDGTIQTFWSEIYPEFKSKK